MKQCSLNLKIISCPPLSCSTLHFSLGAETPAFSGNSGSSLSPLPSVLLHSSFPLLNPTIFLKCTHPQTLIPSRPCPFSCPLAVPKCTKSCLSSLSPLSPLSLFPSSQSVSAPRPPSKPLSNIPRGSNLRVLFQYSPAPGSEDPSSLGTHLSPIFLQSVMCLALPSQLLSLSRGWLPLWRVRQQECLWLFLRQSEKRRCGAGSTGFSEQVGRLETLRQSCGLVGRALAGNVEGAIGEGLDQSAYALQCSVNVLDGNKFLLHC